MNCLYNVCCDRITPRFFGKMAEKTPEEKLGENIGKFLEVYKILTPEARIGFEIEIAKKMKER